MLGPLCGREDELELCVYSKYIKRDIIDFFRFPIWSDQPMQSDLFSNHMKQQAPRSAKYISTASANPYMSLRSFSTISPLLLYLIFNTFV